MYDKFKGCISRQYTRFSITGIYMQAIYFKVLWISSEFSGRELVAEILGNFMYMGQHNIRFSSNKVTIGSSFRQSCRLVGVEYE